LAIWHTGKVAGHKHWSDTLHTLYVEAEIEPFEAGQFIKIGLNINGQEIAHPYSLVNPPDTTPLAFYYIEVPNGQLTPHLVMLKEGDNILIAPKAHGFLILDEVPVSKHLWLIATGTGVGPFLSILSTSKPWQRYEHVILVYAVRTLAELSYQEQIQQLLVEHPNQLSFIPFVSRENIDFALTGRIPQAVADGRLEARAGININAEDSQIMLCGNPQMIKDTTNILIDRGLKKHKRFSPGQISSENYW
jgi:ferredoxin/flavodoxin---NADP+ reductase